MGDIKFYEQKVKQLFTLIEVSNIVNSTLNLNLLLSKVISEIKELMNCEGSSLLLLDKETNDLIFHTIKGQKSKELKQIRIPYGKGIAGWIVKHKKPVIVNDVSKDKRFYSVPDKITKFKTKTLLGVPLTAKDEVIGVIEAINKKNGQYFTKDDLVLFTALAQQVAISIQNAQLYCELKNLFYNVIKAFASAIETKDVYTYGHSERVTKYSLAIADELKLPEEIKENIQLAGLLHDIGKIGTDENILRKPGKLTEAEYEVIKRHPVDGDKILQNIQELKPLSAGVRSHHERYNGRGYPDRAKGDKIPLIGRIISVSDAYDAMTSDRPYRNAMSSTTAIKELIKCSGTQFDPVIVKAFIRAYKKGKI